jgi:hypothetical protein
MTQSTTLTIETVFAFNGLDVLVARDEGLFEAEGLDLRLAAWPVGHTENGTLPEPARGQGSLVDAHQAAMFQG